jgi:hypothetical protein
LSPFSSSASESRRQLI